MTPATDDQIIALIKRLAELHANGILTEPEISAKKAELLARLSTAPAQGRPLQWQAIAPVPRGLDWRLPILRPLYSGPAIAQILILHCRTSRRSGSGI